MNVTAQWLRDKSVCAEGLAWFLRQPSRERIDVIQKLLNENNPQWANWLICRSLERQPLTRYAVYAAAKVLPIFEAEYPKDLRPRKALEIASTWLDNYGNEKLRLASTIAFAGAMDAARTSRSVAAYAAAYAGGAPTAATVQAVTAAKEKRKILSEIFNYGVGLLIALFIFSGCAPTCMIMPPVFEPPIAIQTADCRAKIAKRPDYERALLRE